MMCVLVLFVDFPGKDGCRDEFGIRKEFEFYMRPMVGDVLTICGDEPFTVAKVRYDVDTAEIEVGFDRGPDLSSAQRWIDNGFKLHDMGGDWPDCIAFPQSTT